MKLDKALFVEKLQKAHDGKFYESILEKDMSILTAMDAYKRVKKYESEERGEVDHIKEIVEAKEDLQMIFKQDIKGLTKNQIYLTHQSAWVNAIYELLVRDPAL